MPMHTLEWREEYIPYYHSVMQGREKMQLCLSCNACCIINPLFSTTTVIMKTLGSEGEGICGAHDVDNGCDVPRAASCVGTVTRPAAPRANGPVTATQWKTSGAPRAPSSRQAHRLRSFFSLLPQLETGQPGMSHHGQGNVAIPAVPETHFILIQARLPFGLFDALLHRVARGSHPHQRRKPGPGWSVGQVIGQLVR